MIRGALLIALLISAVPVRAAAPAQDSQSTAERAEEQKNYETAFRFFTRKNYSKAIALWNEILEKSPGQQTAKKMIRAARMKIDKRDKKEQDKLFRHARRGRYQQALVELQGLLERDSTHPLYRTLQSRLERVTEIVRTAPLKSKAWRKAVVGLNGYIARKEDLRLAHNGLRYARELAPKEKRFKLLLALILEEDPNLVEDRITPGMRLINYKRSQGLFQIQNGRYHQAVKNLNQVLALEPDDLIALKRIGSAYFMLKRYRQAGKVWDKALRLSPKDSQLKKFLARAKAKTGARRKKPKRKAKRARRRRGRKK